MNKKLFGVFFGVVAFFALVKTGVIQVPDVREISDGWFLGVVFVAALIDSINPCAFGVLLLTITFLFSLNSTRRRILQTGFVYILGLFSVYVLIGLGILQTLSFFWAPHFMTRVGGGILIVVGFISVLNNLFPKFPIRLKIPQSAHSGIASLMERGSLPIAFLLGLLVGLYEFPCTGGPYFLILGMLHDKESYASGLGYLLFYNLVFVLPLIIILLVTSNRVVLERVKQWKKSGTGAMRFWGGVLMILIGLLLL